MSSETARKGAAGASRGRAGRRLAGAVVGAMAVVAGLASPSASVPADGDDGRRFIVVLHDSVGDPRAVAAEHARRHGAEVHHVYEHALKGYAASFRGTGVGEAARDGRVAYVEPDGVVTTMGTQSGATWGLDRVDQRALPLSNSFTYTATGSGVTAYVIDTGIRTTHGEFGGRAVNRFDAFLVPALGGDCNGHGTHVAGTVGGTRYGVAKAVKLVGVRVLDCTGAGSTSGVIAGVDWVTGNHTKPAVANMSLGGGASTSLDDAVKNSVKAGVTYAIAAGNGNVVGVHQDACNSSPARVAEAMTIGATENTDKKASWSNYGSCVDFFAPGVGITSAWWTSDAATNTISGTSMAAPHGAGVAALYLQGNPAASPDVVRSALYAKTTKGVVASSSTANNHLLFTDY